MSATDVRPGMRVRITQTIARREGNWATEVEGVVTAIEPAMTGSWYAHAKDDRYWLLRVKLRRDDGEETLLALDQNSQIAVVGTAEAKPVPQK